MTGVQTCALPICFPVTIFPHAILTSYEDYSDALKALKDGEIKLFYDDKLAVEYYIVKSNLFHLIKSVDNLVSKKKVQAISANKELADIFNNGSRFVLPRSSTCS